MAETPKKDRFDTTGFDINAPANPNLDWMGKARRRAKEAEDAHTDTKAKLGKLIREQEENKAERDYKLTKSKMGDAMDGMVKWGGGAAALGATAAVAQIPIQRAAVRSYHKAAAEIRREHAKTAGMPAFGTPRNDQIVNMAKAANERTSGSASAIKGISRAAKGTGIVELAYGYALAKDQADREYWQGVGRNSVVSGFAMDLAYRYAASTVAPKPDARAVGIVNGAIARDARELKTAKKLGIAHRLPGWEAAANQAPPKSSATMLRPTGAEGRAALPSPKPTVVAVSTPPKLVAPPAAQAMPASPLNATSGWSGKPVTITPGAVSMNAPAAAVKTPVPPPPARWQGRRPGSMNPGSMGASDAQSARQGQPLGRTKNRKLKTPPRPPEPMTFGRRIDQGIAATRRGVSTAADATMRGAQTVGSAAANGTRAAGRSAMAGMGVAADYGVTSAAVFKDVAVRAARNRAAQKAALGVGVAALSIAVLTRNKTFWPYVVKGRTFMMSAPGFGR